MKPRYAKQEPMTQKANRAAAFAAVNMGQIEKLDAGLIARCHGLSIPQVEELIAERKARPSVWDDLESPLFEEPKFLTEEPGNPGDDPKLWPEIERQSAFINYMRKKYPGIEVHAIPNAANRGQKAANNAMREGLKLGVFDTFIGWDVRSGTIDGAPTVAWIEWKGFAADGRAGKLSQKQIDWGNAMTRKGFSVACFFTVRAALQWLANIGAPIRGRVDA